MSELSKKAGYVAGLLSNSLENSEDIVRVLQAMADLSLTITDHVESLETQMNDLNDYVESIDDDLAELEAGGSVPEYDDVDEPAPAPLRVLHGGEEESRAANDFDDIPDDVPAIRPAVCPLCKTLFLVSANDPASARYICPGCDHRILPDPMTPDNIHIVPAD